MATRYYFYIAVMLSVFAPTASHAEEDFAPSGREDSVRDVYRSENGQNYSITQPGRDAGSTHYEGNRAIVDFDKPSQPAHENDTTINDHRGGSE